MNRRSLLRRALALPLAGTAMKAELAKGGHVPLLGVGMGTGGDAPMPAGGTGSELRRFFSWQAYWDAAKDDVKEQTRNIHSIDPDLCAMESLPLNTKFRLQRARNFDRYRKNQADWFTRMFRRNGHVTRYE